jgi:hypothetical protein
MRQQRELLDAAQEEQQCQQSSMKVSASASVLFISSSCRPTMGDAVATQAVFGVLLVVTRLARL